MSKTVDRCSRGESSRRRQCVIDQEVVEDDGTPPAPARPPLGIFRDPAKKTAGSAAKKVRSRPNPFVRPVFTDDGRWWVSMRLAEERVGASDTSIAKAIRHKRPYKGVRYSFKPFPGVAYAGR